MKITKQLLRETIIEELKKVLAEQANYTQARDISRAKNDLRRAKKAFSAAPGMVNIVSNIDRAMLMIDTIYDMILTPTDYNQENAQNLGLLPPKK